MTDPVEKCLLFPRGNTIVRVTAVDENPMSFSEGMHLMHFIDLRTQETHSANFVEEIGKEFFPLPPDFPQEKIDAYIKAADDRDTANDRMLEIEMGILNAPPER